MLLDIKSEDYLKPFSRLSWIGIPIISLLALFFIYKIGSTILSDNNSILSSNTAELAQSYGGIKAFSESLLKKYLFAFEYVSTLLFAAIVAVISIVQLDWKGRKK